MAITLRQRADLAGLIAARIEVLKAEISTHRNQSRNEGQAQLRDVVADPGEHANAEAMSDVEQSETERDQRELTELEQARGRLAAGSYGNCIDCGGDIDVERLLARPGAVRCLDCQMAHEKHGGPPWS